PVTGRVHCGGEAPTVTEGRSLHVALPICGCGPLADGLPTGQGAGAVGEVGAIGVVGGDGVRRTRNGQCRGAAGGHATGVDGHVAAARYRRPVGLERDVVVPPWLDSAGTGP